MNQLVLVLVLEAKASGRGRKDSSWAASMTLMPCIGPGAAGTNWKRTLNLELWTNSRRRHRLGSKFEV